MGKIKFLYDIATWTLLGTVVILAFFTISSNTNALGGYRSYLVQSGSMEPTIMTGDIVIVQAARAYGNNDVITFRDQSGRVVTHRITSVEGSSGNEVFQTKGDANRSLDQDTVSRSQIIGNVAFIVPKLGYLVGFAKSPPGLVLFIAIPTFLLISSEILNIMKPSHEKS